MALLRRVRFQPDYHMGAQFAGVVVAQAKGLYKKLGVELEVMPLKGAGEFAEEISTVANDVSGLTVGSTEQYILLNGIAKQTAAPVQAVAAMFGRSPLALAALPGRTPWEQGGAGMRIGVHDDTVHLLQRLLPRADVVSVARSEKLSLLRGGEIDAAQVYDVMETLEMEDDLGMPPAVCPLEALGAQLGYAQVLFASEAALADAPRRELLQAFLRATFDGWAEAARAPDAAAAALLERYPDEVGAHGVGLATRSVARCADYVRRARCAGTPGAIDSARWMAASAWIGGSGGRAALEREVWAPDPLLLDGDSLAARLLERVTTDAAAVGAARGGAAPRLALLSVGDLAEGHTAQGAAARAHLAPEGQSWFNKGAAGRRCGVEVETVDLPTATTTAQLLATLQNVCTRCDGVQLMWPLPAHIDAAAAYAAVPPHQDVDGAHYVGNTALRARRRASCPSSAAVGCGPAEEGYLPVTPAAVLELLEDCGVELPGQRALVIGRSRIVGGPLAQALLERNATVSIAHSHTHDLAELCRAADLVVSCAGVPGLVKGAWIKPGAGVVSVGTTFCAGASGTPALLPDLEPDLAHFRHAAFVVSAPGGVGPLSLAILFRNVVAAAAAASSVGAPAAATAPASAAAAGGADATTPAAAPAAVQAFLRRHPHWRLTADPPLAERGGGAEGGGGAAPLRPPSRALVREVALGSHGAAAALLAAAGTAGDALEHHLALAAVEHRCTRGVGLTMRAYTTSTGDVTAHDLRLAAKVEALVEALAHDGA